MTACVAIGAGICGFQTRAATRSEDPQNVTFEGASSCGKIAQLGRVLTEHGSVDADQEISQAG